MCFKKLRSLKNLDKFSDEGKTAVSQRIRESDYLISSNVMLLSPIAIPPITSMIDEIRPPSDLPEHILAKLTGDIDKDLEMIKEWKN